jgi:hypothetical protein
LLHTSFLYPKALSQFHCDVQTFVGEFVGECGNC